MDSKYKVGGYVKLAKLWERSKDAVVAYHSSYYAEKFKDDTDKLETGLSLSVSWYLSWAAKYEILDF